MKRAMAVAVLLLAAAACGGDSGGEAAADEPDRTEEAINVCRQSVEGKLKAPATAEWSDEAAESQNARDDYVLVTGSVDAENGFGALIRMEWTCNARLLSDDDWSVETTITD